MGLSSVPTTASPSSLETAQRRLLLLWMLLEVKPPDVSPAFKKIIRKAKAPLRVKLTTPAARRKLAQTAFADIHAGVEKQMTSHLRAWQTGKFRVRGPVAMEKEWRRRAQRTLRQAYFDSYRAGKLAATGKAVLSDAEIAAIEKKLRAEYKYLRKFGRKLRDDPEFRFQAKAVERQGMHADSTRALYNQGFVANAADNVAITWKLTPAEHCDDCLRLAAGGPYRKPGDKGKKVAKLPILNQVPGDGQTRCLTNCKCYLKAGKIKSAEGLPTRSRSKAEPEEEAFLRSEEMLAEHGGVQGGTEQNRAADVAAVLEGGPRRGDGDRRPVHLTSHLEA